MRSATRHPHRGHVRGPPCRRRTPLEVIERDLATATIRTRGTRARGVRRLQAIRGSRRLCRGAEPQDPRRIGFRDFESRPQTEFALGDAHGVSAREALLSGPDHCCWRTDEHLDLESIKWLERFLRALTSPSCSCRTTRDFMNASRRSHRDPDAKLVTYTELRVVRPQREAEALQLAAAARTGEEERHTDRGSTFSTVVEGRAVQSRITMLEKVERIRDRRQRSAMKMASHSLRVPSQVVITLDHLPSLRDTRSTTI